jgi:hypothetical protein
MTFSQEARTAQIAWKHRSTTLPDGAQAKGRYRDREYDFCLPRDCARLNLLPEARDTIGYFDAAAIPWHDGVDGGPSNHLCDSQVQCVNALAPLARDPELTMSVFGETLQIATPLPMRDPAAPDECIAFEWIGEGDPLGEWVDGVGTRGAKNTSADAALCFLDRSGRTVLTLVEWKYTEQYVETGELQTSRTSQATRDARYRHLFDDANGPLRHDLVPYADFFVEPVYQLFRLSLLAWQLERSGAADVVRVLYCAPFRNAELWRSLNRASHRAASAGNLGDLWRRIQRRPDRFDLFDTAHLVTPIAPTSSEFKSRYGHMAGSDNARE